MARKKKRRLSGLRASWIKDAFVAGSQFCNDYSADERRVCLSAIRVVEGYLKRMSPTLEGRR